MPPSSTRPWSMAASSTPTAPTPGWARASGSWSRPTRATAASCACRPPSAVVTNIDPEHMEHYGSFDALRDAFHAFVERVPFYGFAALVHRPSRGPGPLRPGHRPAPRHLRLQPAGRRARPAARGRGRRRGVRRRDPRQGTARASGGWSGCSCRCRGCTTSQNALAAIAVARELGIPDEVVRRTLSGLEGVKRRFTRTGTVDGVGIIDDYGHHPVEIRAVLRTARARTKGRVIAVVQPHRYTPPRQPVRRVLHLLPRRRHRAGGAGLRRRRAADRGCRAATRWSRACAATATATCAPIDGPDDLAPLVADIARPGDLVVCLGAGSITQWANALPGPTGGAREGGGRGMSGWRERLPAAPRHPAPRRAAGAA